MISVTSVEAQNRFGQLVDSAQREPIVITRRGRPAAYIVSPREMEELLEARRMRGQVRESEHRQWADACADGWNEVHDEHGSFADEHSTL
ncbi:type II toxin-antitoxin system prevent-host-death family antitoxin [Variovorax sp. KK3]|uniref:type II toxin-antitoxin system prevent-host-death family antitoxin n=1 Tax=Variovorax sp. KK3 TaxID=1855728 RepID=UPI00097C82E4|nr:type II toxin-antitoxin system prevent-host-death family antitoxin [Variovorax sp. KK3]